MPIKLTAEQIEAGRSLAGGFTKARLAEWGVPWPPPKGWQEALLAGQEVIPRGGQTKGADELLRQVVLMLIEQGRGSDLHGLPDVLAYFGAQLPEDLAGATRSVVSDTNLPDAPF